MDNLIDYTYEKAIEVLKQNITPHGFTASTQNIANYHSIWARDHCICSLSAILSEDEELIKCAYNGILFILKKQIDNGQVPSYVQIEGKKKVYGGLGNITTIDSNMWVAITSAILFKNLNKKSFISDSNIERYKKFYRLFKAFDSNDCGLMEVHIASDWADIINRTYHVLYVESLYYESLRALKFLFESALKNKNITDISKKDSLKRVKWIAKRQPKVKRKINSELWFTKNNIDRIKEEYLIYGNIPKKNYCYYQSHVMPFKNEWSHRFDTFGNIMAILCNVANKEKSQKIIRYAIRNKINQPYPIKSLDPVILKKDKDWENIYEFKDAPYTYHNGGIWPMLSGFWINCLSKTGNQNKAEEELKKLAELIEKDNFVFNEYVHGRTAEPMGTPYQAWSAAGYIMAYQSVKKNVNLFNF